MQLLSSVAYKNVEIRIHAVSSEIEREYIRESSIFTKFFSSSFIKIEYEDVVEIEAEHEAQEELEIDLEDLEDDFIIVKEKSESESDIADSCYERE